MDLLPFKPISFLSTITLFFSFIENNFLKLSSILSSVAIWSCWCVKLFILDLFLLKQVLEIIRGSSLNQGISIARLRSHLVCNLSIIYAHTSHILLPSWCLQHFTNRKISRKRNKRMNVMRIDISFFLSTFPILLCILSNALPVCLHPPHFPSSSLQTNAAEIWHMTKMWMCFRNCANLNLLTCSLDRLCLCRWVKSHCTIQLEMQTSLPVSLAFPYLIHSM